MASQLQALLEKRLKGSPSKKMDALAAKTHRGEASAFGGLFPIVTLAPQEVETLHQLLSLNAPSQEQADSDLPSVRRLTEEVRAIEMQSILLHGERIRQAQQIFSDYQTRTFSEWLLLVYGNRQTPYNFLHYYLLHQSIPVTLQEKLPLIPKQAIYCLATREGSLERKISLIEGWSGEKKQIFLGKIREHFPLKESDARLKKNKHPILSLLQKACELFQNQPRDLQLTKSDRHAMVEAIQFLHSYKDRL